MDASKGNTSAKQPLPRKTNENIQVYVRVRPLNTRERCIRSTEVVEVLSPREIVTRHSLDSKLTKKFTFDRSFGPDSRQVEVYSSVVAPLIEEVLAGYNCTVFAYGQTGTGKTHTMVGNECPELKSSWEDDSDIGIIPRALSHLFDELRMMELEFTMRISYLELYNEELCDLLSTDDSIKIRIYDDTTKKGSVIIQGLEEITVHSKDDVYKLLEMGKERRKTATTLMNAQSSRSHTVFSIVVHIRENGIEGEDMLKIGKLNLVDLAGSENVSKAGNEKAIRVRETVNINQSLLTLGRVITALVERTPHIPYRESKLTRLLQESLGGRTKTSIIATISPGHKDIEETLSTLEYAHRAKNIQNRPEVNQKLTKKTVLKEYTEEIDKLKRDLIAARDKNGIYLAEATYNEMTYKMDSQNRELNEKMLHLKALKDELVNKEKIFNEVSMNLITKTEDLRRTEQNLTQTKSSLHLTKKILDTTKRRYQEKKALIASHVKTEQELTTQATQILEVADIATSDTQKLHHTIERRKDVDDEIRAACENFTTVMGENFELLGDNLAMYQQKHIDSAQLLKTELGNCLTVQSRLLNNSETNVNNLKQSCLEGFAATSELHAEFAKCMGCLAEEQRGQLTKLFDIFKSREAKMEAQIQSTLGELVACNEQHKTNLEAISAATIKNILQNSEAASAHAKEMQAQLAKVSALAEEKFKALAQLQIEIENEKALEDQQQLVIDNFVREMQQFRELRMKSTENKTLRLGKLDECEKLTAAQTQLASDKVVACAQQHQLESTAFSENTGQQITTGMQDIDRGVAKCSTLREQLDNRQQENSSWINDLETTQSAHCVRMHQASADSEQQVKRLRMQNETQVDMNGATLSNGIREAVHLTSGHVGMAESYLEELTSHFTEYQELHDEHVKDATKKVSGFRQRKLTYSSTGATPSKRDFIYPRVLAATSPHPEIIKRYREMNDCPDLDMTVPLDETCEDVREETSVQDFSSTEALLNSTPVALQQAAMQKKKETSHNGRSANTLKPPMDTQRSNSTNRPVSPKKSLTPYLSAVQNKENSV